MSLRKTIQLHSRFFIKWSEVNHEIKFTQSEKGNY
jgi:hypothetical protein